MQLSRLLLTGFARGVRWAPGFRHHRGLCALGHAIRRIAWKRLWCDPGPGLATAQEAQHTAFDFKLVVSDRCDCGAVGLAILGVVDLAFPLLETRLLFHVDQDRHAQSRPILF